MYITYLMQPLLVLCDQLVVGVTRQYPPGGDPLLCGRWNGPLPVPGLPAPSDQQQAVCGVVHDWAHPQGVLLVEHEAVLQLEARISADVVAAQTAVVVHYQQLTWPTQINRFTRPAQINRFTWPAQINRFTRPAQINRFTRPAQINRFTWPAQINRFTRPAQINRFTRPTQINRFTLPTQINRFTRPT